MKNRSAPPPPQTCGGSHDQQTKQTKPGFSWSICLAIWPWTRHECKMWTHVVSFPWWPKRVLFTRLGVMRWDPITLHSFNVNLIPQALRPTCIEIYWRRIYFIRHLVLARAWLGRHDDSWLFRRIDEDSWWFAMVHNDLWWSIVNPRMHRKSKQPSPI